MTPIIEAHISRGPDLLPHTAEMRYASGRPSPTNRETSSSVVASIRNAETRKRKGADCATIDVVLTKEMELASGRKAR